MQSQRFGNYIQILGELSFQKVMIPLETQDRFIFPALPRSSRYSQLSMHSPIIKQTIPDRVMQQVLSYSSLIFKNHKSLQFHKTIIPLMTFSIPILCLINLPLPFFLLAFIESKTFSLITGVLIFIGYIIFQILFYILTKTVYFVYTQRLRSRVFQLKMFFNRINWHFSQVGFYWKVGTNGLWLELHNLEYLKQKITISSGVVSKDLKDVELFQPQEFLNNDQNGFQRIQEYDEEGGKQDNNDNGIDEEIQVHSLVTYRDDQQEGQKEELKRGPEKSKSQRSVQLAENKEFKGRKEDQKRKVSYSRRDSNNNFMTAQQVADEEERLKAPTKKPEKIVVGQGAISGMEKIESKRLVISDDEGNDLQDDRVEKKDSNRDIVVQDL